MEKAGKTDSFLLYSLVVSKESSEMKYYSSCYADRAWFIAMLPSLYACETINGIKL